MKKIIYTSALLIIILGIQSCDKHMEKGINKSVTIDTTLLSEQVYQLDLGQYGDEDDVATITKQGTAYTVSSITNTPGKFAPVYKYAASTAKFDVTDQVIISITEGSHNNNGNCRNSHSDSTIVTLNFTIKE